MATPVNKSKQHYNSPDVDARIYVAPTPLLEEIKPDYHTAKEYLAAGWLDDAPTILLPTVGIDQLPTQVSLRAVPKPTPFSSSHQLADGISVYDQPTWILPVIPGSGIVYKSQPADASETTRRGYVALLRDLVKNSGIYALSSLASPLVSLVLAPFLTHTLSRTDYGALAVLNTVVALVTGLTELGLNAAYTRMHSFDCKTRRDQFDALSTLVSLLLLVLVPLTAIGVLLAPWLSILVLGSSSYSGAVQVSIVLVLLQNLSLPGLTWLRAEHRALLFSIISILNLLITAGANIILVGVLHLGVIGSLTATGLGNALMIVAALPLIFWYAGFRLRPTMALSMLAFGIPHALNVASGWVLQLSDRSLLGHFASLSTVASYSVAYSLGGVLSAVIITPFSLSWWVLMYPIAKRDDAKHVFKLIFRWFSIVLLFATFGLSLFSIGLLHLLFPASYYAEATIIPIVALSIMFNGVCVVVSLGTSLQRKTWIASIYILLSALLNVILNLILIPLYGAMGAAIATLLAYFALALMSYIANQWIYPVPFEIGLFFIALGIGIGLYIASDTFASGQNEMIAWGIHITAFLLYGIVLALLGFFASCSKTDRQSKAERGTL
jgi:O-antigen/teichoic acid export membrane protein